MQAAAAGSGIMRNGTVTYVAGRDSDAFLPATISAGVKTSEDAQGTIASAMVALVANKSALARFEVDGNILGDVR